MQPISGKTHDSMRQHAAALAPGGKQRVGQHVMADGTVMDGACHDHSRHAPAPPANTPAPNGDQSQVEYTLPMHSRFAR